LRSLPAIVLARRTGMAMTWEVGSTFSEISTRDYNSIAFELGAKILPVNSCFGYLRAGCMSYEWLVI
jgi:hypothetical protein